VESLRWILLAAGAIFVLVIYLLGRSRKRRNHSVFDELEDDLPEFSARSLDDVDEGVGEVRVITNRATEDEAGFESFSTSEESGYAEAASDATANADDVEGSAADSQPGVEQADKSQRLKDIIVLYILPKGDPHNQQALQGAQINSSAQAMGLSFGDMSIFHYTVNGRNVFSLANMLEPGSFDPETIHDLKTSGLTVFMQLHQGDPMDDLTEMLQRSYQLAGLLDARLCNHKRETLTEQDAENYRQQVREFISHSEPELTS
jgi:cell division protein ZipA